MIGVGIMIANLPLLFSKGHPTALSKIAATELEKFITFMVTCSWGHDTAKDIRRPPWWPKDVIFAHPFKRPQEVPKDWEVRLKNLVRKCYDYHKSQFLLVFSAQLARYRRQRLKYVDNRDRTTSVYYTPTGRLLVTFRNENLFYDRNHVPISARPLRSEPHVKSADIYLCDNCDSHFDNIDVLRTHERLCNNHGAAPTSTCSGGLQEFLSSLKLQPISTNNETAPTNVIEGRSRQIRSATNIDRGPPYPFSSLAYMRNVKANSYKDFSHSRERIERYCNPLPSSGKNLFIKSKNNQFPIRYRRPVDYWQRRHVFPNQRYKELLDINGQLLLFKCRPIKVNIERMSLDSMQSYIDKLKEESKSKKAEVEKDIEFVAGCDNEVAIETEMLKVVDPLTRSENNCEVIDLCSDDESVNENCDPRAGVTCVMRGGAVLRRTATTPSALPDEPCGARHRPVMPAILQPQPVILFAQSLSNLQTIAID